MRSSITILVLFSGLLLCATPQLQAAKKSKAAADKSSDYKEIPAFNWNLVSSGFIEVFKLRNREIESAEPNRYFPASVAFALGRLDESGHFLMLKCGSSASCNNKRDALEDRMMYATLLEVVRTPKVTKDQLYNPVTWELTSLGEQYIEKLRKRYPDLPARLGKLLVAALANR